MTCRWYHKLFQQLKKINEMNKQEVRKETKVK